MMDEKDLNYIKIEIPLPANFVSLLEELKAIAGEIKTDLEKISKLREKKISYSEQETAELLEMKLSTLENARRTGKISFSRISKRARYTTAQIQDYLNSVETTRIGGKKEK